MPIILGPERRIFKGHYTEIWETDFFDKKGWLGHWEWQKGNGAVFVLPITDQQELVLIKNFRIPLKAYAIEMVAGLRDKPGEDDLAIARRELQEEVRYQAENFIPFPRRWSNSSGSSNALAAGFFATGLTPLPGEPGDATEDITPLKVPWKALDDFYFNTADELIFDIKILAFARLAEKLGLLR